MGFKSKNIFLISFLAIAGIFGVSSAVIDKEVEQYQVVNQASASTANEHILRLITPNGDWWDDGGCSNQIWSYGLNKDFNPRTNSRFTTEGSYNKVNFNGASTLSWRYQEFDLGSDTLSSLLANGGIQVKRRLGYSTTHSLDITSSIRSGVYNSLKNGSSNTICIYATSDTSNYWINDGSDGYAYMSNYVVSLKTSDDADWKNGTGYTQQAAYLYNTTFNTPSNLGDLPSGYVLSSWRKDSPTGSIWTDSTPTADVDLHAAYSSIGTEGHGRIWVNRTTHYLTGYTWLLWDGINGATAYSPNYHGEYLYYDIGMDLLVGKYIVLQVRNDTSKNIDASTVTNEFCYTSGDNSYLLYPFHDGNWHIGKGTVRTLSKVIGTDIFNDVLYPYLTCSSNKDYGYGSIANLYKTWVWNGSESSIDGCFTEDQALAKLGSHTLSYQDYGYSVGPSGVTYDYSNASNRNGGYTTALEKITALKNMASSGNPNHASIRNFSFFNIFNGEENGVSTIIIIVASSVALLSVTALSILVLKKRKSKEQE